MADSETAASQPNWRISKACQECRHRKIRCNGESPCKTCSLRRTPCVYREVIRQRKKKQKPQQDAKPETSDSANVPTGTRPGVQSHREDPPPSFNNSVSATHMTSPSNTVQLYYGSTSHFALMHEIYRDLTAHPARDPAERHGRVEEVGAGLDMLSFRSIFFGIPADQSGDHTRRSVGADPHIMFLPYELANTFLESFLGSLYYLLPIWPPEVFYRRLEKLYGPSPDPRTDYYQCILLMALALGSLITEHAAWGDVLYERVRASCSSLDDTVNLQAVQLSMFMHAHYHNEVGRPNSCFLHIGTAARKAISTGLHKESPNESADTVDSAEERRRTFWYLYIYETWVCFHLGRPSSLSRRDVGIPLPKDAFCHTITSLADAAARSADELYGQHHGSLLQMWRIAKSIWDDLRTFDSKMQAALGFGLDKRPQPGGRGVMQTMCITLYYQIILLTFRPFLIFRGRWNQDSRIGTSTADSEKPSPKREIPPWLNEACGYALSAAIRTIHFLCESYTANDLVRGIRYHAYFLGSSCFALIFDLIHGKDLAATHLPWIHATLQALSSMRPGDPIQASILAIQTILKQIDPAYEWSPVQSQPATAHPLHSYTSSQGTPARTYLAPAPASGPTPGVHTSDPHTASALLDSLPSTFLPGATHDNPFLYDFQGNSLEQGMRVGVGIAGGSGSGSVGGNASVGSGPGEELLDFTLSDMGGDFDFSTMDLETFFSITPGFGPGV